MAKATHGSRRRPTKKARRPKALPPLDLFADITSELTACGLTLEALQKPGAVDLVDRLSRNLAAKLIDSPLDRRPMLRVAALAGYLAAITKGLQLGAAGLERWRGIVLATVSDAYEKADLDAEARDFLTGVLVHDKNLVLPDDMTRPH